MQIRLEREGYEVLPAPDCLRALDILDAESPDLVLMDVGIPGMQAAEVLGRIKDTHPDIEVIVITSEGDMGLAVECLRKKASSYLTKPVNNELMLVVVEQAIEKIALKRVLKENTRLLETRVREANNERELAYRFRENIIENSPDAIVCVRKGGEITLFNPAAERLLGYRKDEVVGRMNIVRVYPPGVAKDIMRDLRSADFGGPGILQKREVALIDREGKEIPVYISAALLYENQCEAGSVGIFTDLRERKKLEQQLLRTEKLSSLGKLSAGIAHEINQPLTGVLTFSHFLLKRFQNDEKARKEIEIIIRETTRIKGIVQGILDFAREIPMQRKPWRIEDILRNTLELIVHQERFFGVSLGEEYDPAIPILVVDGNLVQQVFLNIILNGLDAMKGNGTLTIRTRQVEGFVEIDFEDTGDGIPEDIMGRIFDPFFTTKSSTEGMGMGLGLAVSYGIINNHNGDIQVGSKPGQGSLFTVRLPLEE